MSKHQGQTQATHQAPVEPKVETTTIQSEPQEPQVKENKEAVEEQQRVNDIADIIGVYLPGVMRDRKNMRTLELRVDEYIRNYRGSRDMTDIEVKRKAVKEVMDQLMTASGAIESIIMRSRPILES